MSTIVWIAIAALLVLVVLCAWGYSRLRRLTKRAGTFDCAYRSTKDRTPELDKYWANGLCEYRSDRLVWWRLYSLKWEPSRTWLRQGFDLVGRSPLEAEGLPDVYLVQCNYEGAPFELMMSAEAYHGLASWVESAPPSIQGYVF